MSSVTIQHTLALAVTDGHFNFFILAGLLGSFGLVAAHGTRSFIGYSALMGLSAGLACSVKITGLPVVAFFYCLLLPPVWRTQGLNLRTGLYGPLAAILTALVVVYVLNPFFWPFESPSMMLEFPRLYVRTRDAFASMPNDTWGTPPHRLRGIHEYMFSSGFSSVPGELAAFAAGVVVCAWKLMDGLRKKRFDIRGVLLVYFIAHYVFIVSLIQFNWARYYLPLVFSMKLLAAIGVAAPLYWIWTAAQSQVQPVRTQTGAVAAIPD